MTDVFSALLGAGAVGALGYGLYQSAKMPLYTQKGHDVRRTNSIYRAAHYPIDLKVMQELEHQSAATRGRRARWQELRLLEQMEGRKPTIDDIKASYWEDLLDQEHRTRYQYDRTGMQEYFYLPDSRQRPFAIKMEGDYYGPLVHPSGAIHPATGQLV